jgi:hypothetical protein
VTEVETFLDTGLDLDEDELTAERGAAAPEIIGDEDVRVLLRKNRIALARGPVATVPSGQDGVAAYDVPLSCVVHAHPQCSIQWSRLLVDLSPTDGARISDMAPREVSDDHPVELTTSVGVGLKFEILAKVLSAEIKPEVTRKSTVYLPQIVSSGPGFTRGYWDFLSSGGRFPHVDRHLRLLVTAPAGRALTARLRFQAKVTVRGAARLIPLVAKGKSIDRLHTLAG